MRPLRLAAALILAVSAVLRADTELARINDAIEALIGLIDSDRPFLVFDRGAAELRLQHGSAILRSVPALDVVDDGHAELTQRLRSRLRRYGAVPFQPIAPGAFDWEQYLALEADDECALWFDGGLLIYADEAWTPAAAPSVRLTTEDLRALFDAVADSTAIVLLPAGWDVASETEQE